MRLSSPHGRRFAQVRGAQPEITSHHAKPSPHPPPSPLPTAAPLGKIPAPPSRLERGSAARPTPPAPPGAGGAAAQHSHPGRRRGRCLGSAPRCQQNGVYSPVAFARLSARWARARPGGQERGEAAEGVGRRGDARGGGGHGHALPVRALRGEHECRSRSERPSPLGHGFPARACAPTRRRVALYLLPCSRPPARPSARCAGSIACRLCALLFSLTFHQVRQGARAAGDAPLPDSAGRPLLLLLVPRARLRQWCTQKARRLSAHSARAASVPGSRERHAHLGLDIGRKQHNNLTGSCAVARRAQNKVRARCADARGRCACACTRERARVRKRARASVGWGREVCARLFWYLARAPGPPNFLGSQRRGSATSSERSYASSTSLMSLFSCSPMSAWARGAREIGDERGERRVRRRPRAPRHFVPEFAPPAATAATIAPPPRRRRRAAHPSGSPRGGDEKAVKPSGRRPISNLCACAPSQGGRCAHGRLRRPHRSRRRPRLGGPHARRDAARPVPLQPRARASRRAAQPRGISVPPARPPAHGRPIPHSPAPPRAPRAARRDRAWRGRGGTDTSACRPPWTWRSPGGSRRPGC